MTLRRLDLAAEIYHLREPQKVPLVMSPDETKRLLAVASSLKARVMLSLSYGCGLRAREVVRLKVKHIDSAQKIIRSEQSKGRKGPQCHAVVRDARSAATMVEGATIAWRCGSSRAGPLAFSEQEVRQSIQQTNDHAPAEPPVP